MKSIIIFFYFLSSLNWGVPVTARPFSYAEHHTITTPPAGYVIAKAEGKIALADYRASRFIAYADLEKLSDKIYHNIYPKNDPVGRDIWTQSALKRGYGDCEDYVLALRHELIKQKINGKSFYMAVVYTQIWEQYHLILIVDTSDKGKVAFDGMKGLVPVSDYRIYKYQSLDDADHWLTP